MRTSLMVLPLIAALGGCAAPPKQETQSAVEPALLGRTCTVIDDQERPAPGWVGESMSAALARAGCLIGSGSNTDLLFVCRTAPAGHPTGAIASAPEFVRVTSVWPGDIPIPHEWRLDQGHPWSAIVEVRVSDAAGVATAAAVEEVHVRVAARAPEESALRRDGLHALWRVLDAWAAAPNLDTTAAPAAAGAR